MSLITHRRAQANNKYLGDNYNPSVPPSYNFYVKANNLYGHAMSQILPARVLAWMDQEELQAVEKVLWAGGELYPDDRNRSTRQGVVLPKPPPRPVQ